MRVAVGSDHRGFALKEGLKELLGALAAIVALSLGVACGGGGEGEVDLSNVEEVMAGALRAISPPGKVGHVEWEWRKGGERWVEEAWVDADNERFRMEYRPGESGEEGSFDVIVGEKWRTATYQSEVESSTVHITAVDREEWVAGGLDNFAYLNKFGYVSFLAWVDERRVVGESSVAGREVVVVEAKRGMGRDWRPGTIMVATMELDKATLLPVGLRSKIVEPDGTETEAYSLARSEWEAVPPDDLAPDFFSPDALFALYSPVQEKLAEASKLDFDLYWLGENYDDAAEGQLDLYLWRVDTETETWPLLRYSSEAMRGPGDVVFIREGLAGQAQFGPRSEMGRPIQQEELMVLGKPAVLYFWTDRLPPSYEVTYRWLVFTLDRTVIELYPFPISEEGQETNPLNNTEALIALAEDLAPVPDEP